MRNKTDRINICMHCICVCVYVCKTVTGGDPISPTMAFLWKGPEAGGSFVYKTACLRSPDLVLESRSGAGDPEDS